MPIYSIEVKICATAYIKAKTPQEAKAAAQKLAGQSPAMLDSGGDVEVSGRAFCDPKLPVISLSPAMTIHGLWNENDNPEKAS